MRDGCHVQHLIHTNTDTDCKDYKLELRQELSVSTDLCFVFVFFMSLGSFALLETIYGTM